jgi:hypothetical protein
MIILTIILFALVACSNTISLPEIQNEEENTAPNTIQNNNENLKQEDLNDKLMGYDNMYIIHHDKDDTTYTITLTKDIKSNYTLDVFDKELNNLQSINLGHIPEGVDFMDVNLDGYTDIVANTGGTWNETHELYIWDAFSQNFTKVVFEGFEMLSFFEVHDGYLENFIRGNDPDDSIKEKVIWNGSTLVKESK